MKIEPISTRKMVRIGIEIPEEQADEVLKLLGGYPKPANPVWVAVAPITQEAAVAFANRANKESPLAPIARALEEKAKSERERRDWSDLSPAQQAGIRCNEPAFWKYLMEKSLDDSDGAQANFVDSEPKAAAYVRLICGVKSRAEFSTNPQAAEKFHSLDVSFNNWLHGLT